MANATLRERQTQYKSCPQELYKLNAQQLNKSLGRYDLNKYCAILAFEFPFAGNLFGKYPILHN
jgi:hypothetical protein